MDKIPYIISEGPIEITFPKSSARGKKPSESSQFQGSNSKFGSEREGPRMGSMKKGLNPALAHEKKKL